MKKAYLLSLFVLLVSSLCTAAPTQQEALERALYSKIKRVSSAPEAPVVKPVKLSRQQQIRLALQGVSKENQFNPATAISFKTFLAKAHQLEQQNQRASHIQEQTDAAFNSAFYFKGQPEMLFQGSPNYAKDLKGKKYIFISEASDHDQQTLVEHTIHILNILRRENPQARILLANEFSLVSDMQAWPIRFARVRNEDLTTFEGYDALEPAADQLNIDILALDDACFEQNEKGVLFAKVGPQWISFDATNPQIQKIVEEFGMDPADQDLAFATFQYFLASNSYGVELRNQQWVSYIKAIEPFYDIIVVYGGNGHLNINGRSDSVPLMLNPVQAVSISLYSTEQLSDQAQAHYDTRNKVQQQFKQPEKPSAPIETFEDQLGEEDLSGDINWTLDFSKPNYRRYDGKVITAWREQHIRNYAAFKRYKQQHQIFENLIGRGPLNFTQWLDLEVYINGN